MKRILCWLPSLIPAVVATPALAHHGVASLGAAGLEGPGAPVETSSSATLPQGKWLGYLKLDHARAKTFDADRTRPEGDYNQYLMLGIGYGIRPWLSAYVFQPYNIKKDEPGGLNARGFTDLTLMGVIGFKYDEGFLWAPANESLDDLMDWHFTAYAGASLPTGDANHRLADGSLDPGKALGFGKPAVNYGLTATRQLSSRATVVFEAGQIFFQKYRYDDGNTLRFGTENRINAALCYRLRAVTENRFRLDANIEANYLDLARDRENGVASPATGGNVLYGVLGLRLYQDNLSLGLAVKRPVWTDLNEAAQQQGTEGKEEYRLIATLSALF